MIYFILHPERPEELSPKAAKAWSRSRYVWEARYGVGPEETDHTHLGYFGLVPLEYLTPRGYWWFALGDARPSREVMRAAKTLFAELNAKLGWETYAHTEVRFPARGRFARAFGFRLLGADDKTLYFRRS